MLLRTLPFSVRKIFPSKLFSFNLFRTLSENMGGGMGFFPFWNSPLVTYLSPLYASSLFSYSYALFCTPQNVNAFVFKHSRTLCEKHPGWGRRYFSPHPDGDADPEESSAEGRLSKSQRLDSSL